MSHLGERSEQYNWDRQGCIARMTGAATHGWKIDAMWQTAYQPLVIEHAEMKRSNNDLILNLIQIMTLKGGTDNHGNHSKTN